MNLREVGSIQISVPPRSLQDLIAHLMHEAYGDRQKKLEQAKKLLQEIDEYVFDILSLAPESVEEDRRFLKSISTIQGGRFDVEFNMNFHKFDPYMDQVLPVVAVAIFPKETQDPTTTPETLFNYIDIASIDIELGEIREVSEVLGTNAPSRARQVVHTGDIIISTVRPTRGATALISESMDGFICSTGFSIVHPNDQVTSEYLHTALRLHTTFEQFGRRSAGSSYPAILDKDVKETLIPVPSKEIQDKISTEVIRRRREAKRLRIEAEAVVAAAKVRIERMILSEVDTY
jgi:Type I restriction modification DNA specificity domain